MSILRRFLTYLRSERWARTVGVVSAVALQLPNYGEIVDRHWRDVDGQWTVASLVMLASALATEAGVFSKKTHVTAVTSALHQPSPDQLALVALPHAPGQVTYAEGPPVQSFAGHEPDVDVAPDPPEFQYKGCL